MKTHRLELRPIYADLDPMDIVYYANYLRFFEQGRTELMRISGLPYSQVEEAGLHFPVTEAHVRYRSPARYDQLIYLDTWIAWMKKASLRFDYRLLRPKEDKLLTLVTGYTVHGCITHQGRVSPLPDSIRKPLEPYLAE